MATPPEVLVVGAGPTGLTLANELARRGVRVRVVDAAAEPNTLTRALGVQARTLELFDRLKLTDEAIARGLPITQFHVLSEGREMLHLDLGTLDTPYPFLLMLPQNEVEELLTARLAGFGVAVERAVALVGLRQDANRCTVDLLHADGTVEHTRVQWVVGCDGAHSAVRDALGLRFHGEAFEEEFAVADVRVDWSLPYDELYAFLNRGKFMTFFPMTGGMHRVALAFPPHGAPTTDVTIDELQRSLDLCGQPGARIVEITHAGRFYINQRYVEHHRVGRVFVAGDAAHVHSVVGAQGMNTGIQDAFNLGWKLALVNGLRADDDLLNSYGAERGPLARRLVQGTRRITRVTLWHNWLTTAVRRDVAPRVLARPAVQKALGEALSQIDVSYRGDGHGHDDRVPANGDRAPDVAVQAGAAYSASRLFHLLHRSEHTLLVVMAGDPGASAGSRYELAALLAKYPEIGRVIHVADAAEPSISGSEVRIGDGGGAMRARYGLAAGGLVLIRPDGYIGLRVPSDSASADPMTECVDALGRYLGQNLR